MTHGTIEESCYGVNAEECRLVPVTWSFCSFHEMLLVACWDSVCPVESPGGSRSCRWGKSVINRSNGLTSSNCLGRDGGVSVFQPITTASTDARFDRAHLD